MPMYEYECMNCGLNFEQLVFNHDEKVVCRSCESTKVEQQLSVFAVVGERSGSSRLEEGPCGSCGAAQRGMCGND
jgi:putative FmdB family regulatory protein